MSQEIKEMSQEIKEMSQDKMSQDGPPVPKKDAPRTLLGTSQDVVLGRSQDVVRHLPMKDESTYYFLKNTYFTKYASIWHTKHFKMILTHSTK